MTEASYPAPWTPEQITAITGEYRAWLSLGNPELSQLISDETLLTLALMAWPHAYWAGYLHGRADEAAGW